MISSTVQEAFTITNSLGWRMECFQLKNKMHSWVFQSLRSASTSIWCWFTEQVCYLKGICAWISWKMPWNVRFPLFICAFLFVSNIVIVHWLSSLFHHSFWNQTIWHRSTLIVILVPLQRFFPRCGHNFQTGSKTKHA